LRYRGVRGRDQRGHETRPRHERMGGCRRRGKLERLPGNASACQGGGRCC
jgi:hypothetical protein